MLKLRIKTLEEVAEAFRAEYEKDGDEFVLKTDGEDKLKEFRSNNLKLMKEKEALSAEVTKFKGIDPERYAIANAALEELEKNEEGQLIKAGKLDVVIERRTKALQKQHQEEQVKLAEIIKKQTAVSNTYKAKLSNLVLRDEITKAVTTVASIREGALDDIINRATSKFSIDDDGNLVPVGPDGTKYHGVDGTTPLTTEDWAKGLVKSATHLFEPSKGAGAGGGDKGGTQPSKDGIKTISRDDPVEFGRNLEAIAKGTVKVAPQPGND